MKPQDSSWGLSKRSTSSIFVLVTIKKKHFFTYIKFHHIVFSCLIMIRSHEIMARQEATMMMIKSHDFLSDLQVRNLMLSTTEETLFQEFSHFKPGSVERVKKLTDYAFVHYYCREDALAALAIMNGVQIDGATIEVMLAKPATIKEDSNSSRKHGNRGYLGNSSTASGGKVCMYRSNGGMMVGASNEDGHLRTMTLPSCMGSPVYTAQAG